MFAELLLGIPPVAGPGSPGVEILVLVDCVEVIVGKTVVVTGRQAVEFPG